jgi:anti-sigma B factor antagonist
MKIARLEHIGDVPVVCIDSEHFDVRNHEQVNREATGLLEGRDRVILDLQRVDVIDSSAVGCVLGWVRRLRSDNGRMVICSIRQPVQLVFDLVRIDRLVTLAPDRKAAVQAFSETLAPEA